jgi:serine/threonine-protein kinase
MEPDPEIEELAKTLSSHVIARTPAPIPISIPAPASEPRRDLPVSSSIALPPRSEKKRGYREKSASYAVIALAVVMLGAGIWGWVRPASAKPVVRSTLLVDSSEAIAGGESWMGRLALSPDGSLLAYINGSHWRLLLRPRNQLHATVVPGTESVKTPFFSTDGRHVGFVSGWKLWIAPVDGGAPIAIADTLIGAAGASWGPDNFIYLDGVWDSGLLRVEATRGAKPKWFTVLDTASGEIDHTWPDVLPNGKGVVFTVAFRKSSGTEERSSHSIAVAEIPSGKHRVIINDAMYPRYSQSGHLLYVTANKTLMVVPFDQNSMKVTGTPVALAEGMRLGVLGSADLAVSATGTLIYATGAGEGKWEAAWVTRDGKIKPVDPEWQGVFLGFPALSPDGKRLAASRNATTEPFHIWIKELDRGPSVKLTFDGRNVGPEWTPDGKSLTFSSDREGGTFALWTKPVDGKGQPVLEFREKRNVYQPRWSPDRKWLVFETDLKQSGAGDILGIRPGIDSAPVPLVATRFAELCPALSPDGHWLAYSSNETGDFEVYVVPFPNTASGKWAISTSGGIEPLWSHRGNELFYLDAADNMVVADLKTKPAFSVVGSKALFPAGDFGASNFAQQYSVAPDDKRFLMIRTLETGTPDKLIVVDNWFEELRSKSH